MCQTLLPWDPSHPSSYCTGLLPMWKSLQTRASRLRRERERERGFKSQLRFLLAWARSGLYTTLVVSESNNGEVEISWLSLLESFTSTSLKVNWSVIVNNTFRRLLLPRLLGKHKNFATCANNSQKEVLAGQNVKLSNWLRIRNWTSSCPRLDQTGCCRQQICELGKLRQDTILLLGKALYQHLLRRVCSDRSYWSGSSPPERQCQRPGDHSPSFCPLNAQESGWIVKSALSYKFTKGYFQDKWLWSCSTLPVDNPSNTESVT